LLPPGRPGAVTPAAFVGICPTTTPETAMEAALRIEKVSVRIEPETASWLRARASAQQRSLSAEIRLLLDRERRRRSKPMAAAS
jgi:hypothetical protein